MSFARSALLVLALVPSGLVAFPVRAAGAPAAAPEPAVAAQVLQPTTVYLPNVTRMLGGPDGWQTPFIVQNVGSAPTDLEMSFYAVADGSLIKTRHVAGLQPGTSAFHDPNSDAELPAGGQFSVVIRSAAGPVVAVVNQHQSLTNATRQEALSYGGLSAGSTAVFLPYVAKNAGGWLTTAIIQNVGSSATTPTLTLYGSAGTVVHSASFPTIEPGRAVTFDPRQLEAIPEGEYSGVVVASQGQPVAVVVNAHNDAPDVAQPRGFSYNGHLAASDERIFLPYVARRSDAIDRTSRVYIQNTGVVASVPRLLLRRHGDNRNAGVVISGPSIPPGAAWAWDPLTATQVGDGDHSLEIIDGKFAAVSAVVSPSTAMGFTATYLLAHRMYLPNVTRTLGGPSGWTTPIVVQSTGAPFFTLRWYRFSDGALIHTQTYADLLPIQAVRIDPREIPELSDDAQYAVVVEAAGGGVAAAVIETSASGGDSAMGYDGFPTPRSAPFGTTACEPGSAPAGTIVRCVFYGLTVGANPVVTIAKAGEAPVTTTDPERVAADGSWDLWIRRSAGGAYSVSLTTGGATQSAQFFHTPPTFSVTVVTSTAGSLTARTSRGLLCVGQIFLPAGSAVPAFYLNQAVADASGGVSWTYSVPTGTKRGQGLSVVRCYAGDQVNSATAALTVK